jgi:hypothetical protein
VKKVEIESVGIETDSLFVRVFVITYHWILADLVRVIFREWVDFHAKDSKIETSI